MRRSLILAIALWLSVAGALVAELIKLQGAPAVAHPISAAAPLLRAEGIELKVSTEGGSTVAIAALGVGQVDLAMTTRPLTAEDRAAFPERRFFETQIGVQAVAVIVSREVWESGVRAVTKQQMLDIYEGRIANWKQLGGNDSALKFFNSERGRGVYELFGVWLYGDLRRAPVGKFPIVVGGTDARDTVQFNSGAMSLATPQLADGRNVFALAIKDEAGTLLEPSIENIRAKTYPLARPTMLVVRDRPAGLRKKVIDFMLSEKGQELVKKSELIPIREIGEE